ncbi:hypothetical protein BTJ45_02946 [Bacillus mycoides]|nr:hypothetical protein BTJ45_02946 [Bacillus mycoides]
MYQNIYWIEIMFIGFYQLQDERYIFVATDLRSLMFKS